MVEWFNWVTPSYYFYFFYISTLFNFKFKVILCVFTSVYHHKMICTLCATSIFYCIIYFNEMLLVFEFRLYFLKTSAITNALSKSLKQLDPVIETLHINSTCHLVLLGTSAVNVKSMSNSLKHNAKWSLIHLQILKLFPVCSGKCKGK